MLNINEQRLYYIMTGNTHKHANKSLWGWGSDFLFHVLYRRDCYCTITCYLLHITYVPGTIVTKQIYWTMTRLRTYFSMTTFIAVFCYILKKSILWKFYEKKKYYFPKEPKTVQCLRPVHAASIGLHYFCMKILNTKKSSLN